MTQRYTLAEAKKLVGLKGFKSLADWKKQNRYWAKTYRRKRKDERLQELADCLDAEFEQIKHLEA